MLESYIPIGVMALLATAGGGFLLFLSWLLGPKRMTAEKAQPYECGMPLLDESYKRLSVRFYLVAAIFILFDIEAAFIFPWALVFRDLGMAGFIEMLVFLGLLASGFAYLWKRGAFDWQ